MHCTLLCAWVEFLKFFQKVEGPEFSHKKEGLVSKGIALKKGVSLSNTNEPFPNYFLSVCGVCTLLFYTISISILCISQEGLGLVSLSSKYVTSIVTFGKQRHCGLRQNIFLYQQVIHSL